MKKMYIEDLPARAREVAPLICRGFSNVEIAKQLYLSKCTVTNCISEMVRKTGSRNRAELAYKLGIYEHELKMLSYIKIKGRGK